MAGQVWSDVCNLTRLNVGYAVIEKDSAFSPSVLWLQGGRQVAGLRGARLPLFPFAKRERETLNGRAQVFVCARGVVSEARLGDAHHQPCQEFCTGNSPGLFSAIFEFKRDCRPGVFWLFDDEYS